MFFKQIDDDEKEDHDSGAADDDDCDDETIWNKAVCFHHHDENKLLYLGWDIFTRLCSEIHHIMQAAPSEQVQKMDIYWTRCNSFSLLVFKSLWVRLLRCLFDHKNNSPHTQVSELLEHLIEDAHTEDAHLH